MQIYMKRNCALISMHKLHELFYSFLYAEARFVTQLSLAKAKCLTLHSDVVVHTAFAVPTAATVAAAEETTTMLLLLSSSAYLCAVYGFVANLSSPSNYIHIITLTEQKVKPLCVFSWPSKFKIKKKKTS